MGKSFLRDNFFDVAADAAGKRRHSDPDGRAESAGRVDLTEQTWLEGRIDGNGKIDAYDQALLDFLTEESGFSRDLA